MVLLARFHREAEMVYVFPIPSRHSTAVVTLIDRKFLQFTIYLMENSFDLINTRPLCIVGGVVWRQYVPQRFVHRILGPQYGSVEVLAPLGCGA